MFFVDVYIMDTRDAVFHQGRHSPFKDWLARTPEALNGMKIQVSGVNKGYQGTVIGYEYPRANRFLGRGPSIEHVIRYPERTWRPEHDSTVALASSTRTWTPLSPVKAWNIVSPLTVEQQALLETQYHEFTGETELRTGLTKPAKGSSAGASAGHSVVGGGRRRTRRRRRGRHGKRARKTGRKASKTRGRRRRGRSTRGRRRR